MSPGRPSIGRPGRVGKPVCAGLCVFRGAGAPGRQATHGEGMDEDALPQRRLPVPPGYARGLPAPWWLKLGAKLALAGVGLHGARARALEETKRQWMSWGKL